MRIRSPATQGKIILDYDGNRTDFRMIRSRYCKIRALTTKELIKGIKEELVVIINLSDGIEVAMSLASGNFYMSSKTDSITQWHENENNFAMIYRIIIDDETAIFKGSFIFNLPFEHTFFEDSYNFMMLFTPSKEIKHTLKNHDMEFESY